MTCTAARCQGLVKVFLASLYWELSCKPSLYAHLPPTYCHDAQNNETLHRPASLREGLGFTCTSGSIIPRWRHWLLQFIFTAVPDEERKLRG